MAVVIPMVAAYFTIGAGVAAAAAATTVMASLAAYAAIAGGVLTGLGALSGDKDISRIGAILSIGGGLGTAASKAATAAEAAGAASSAAAPAGTVDALYGGAGGFDEVVPMTGADAAAGAQAGAVVDASANAAAAAGGEFSADLWGGDTPASLVDGSTPGVDGLFGMGDGVAPADSSSAGGWADQGLGSTPANPLQDAASKMTADDIGGFLKQAANKVGAGLEEVGPWVKKNKELVDLGGKALSSMYGPQAELVQLKKEQMNRERSLMDRAYQNMNSPVKLYNYAKGS